MASEEHQGHVVRRSGSGSKWEKVKCSCGWESRDNGIQKREFEVRWRAHIRALGGTPTVGLMRWSPPS